MILNKHTIKGKRGKTVCYFLPNFRYDINDKLKWDSFRFYTPEGDQTDDEGFKYFDVPGEEILLQRDVNLNKILMIIITKNEGTEILEIYEGAEMELLSVGLEGDIVVSGFIPSDPQQEISINYKEVIDE